MAISNQRIRKAMLDAEINQDRLAEILGVKQSEVSVMLKYELSGNVQRDITARIREWDAQRRGMHHETESV